MDRLRLYDKRRSPEFHGLSKHPLYKTWTQIKRRCYTHQAREYPIYGGRGIKMCDCWRKSFVAFLDYIEVNIGPRPTPRHTIDRINNDLHYEPNNIRWATKAEQAHNRTTNKLTNDDINLIRKLHIRGPGGNTVELARRFGVHEEHIRQIIRKTRWG